MDSYALGDFPVSRIGFGAMQLPGPGVWGPPRDRGEAVQVLRRAVELGVDHIDTAQYYRPGVANELIREALHLIGGVGLSNITAERLRRALGRTSIACVQNPLNLAGRSSMPVLQACAARGIAFVPFFPLGSAFAPDNPVLGNPGVRAIAGRLGATPAQVALAWTLGLAPNVLLIPGTSSVAHLEENLAAAGVTLDEQAQRELTAAQG